MRQTSSRVLDPRVAAELNGQRCDRLRPAQVRRELEQALDRSRVEGCTLVEWRWDLQQGRVEGWLWQEGLLQSFRWWRDSGQLTLRLELLCTSSAPQQVPT